MLSLNLPSARRSSMPIRGLAVIGTALVSVFLHTAPGTALEKGEPPAKAAAPDPKKPDTSPFVRTFEVPAAAGQTGEEAERTIQTAYKSQIEEDMKKGYP